MGFYLDFIFGLWVGDELVLVGKVYFGFIDVELCELDKFVCVNMVDCYGLVWVLVLKLVVEVVFEGLN